MKGIIKKVSCCVLAVTMVVSGIIITPSQQVQAAPKVKSISVKAKSTTLGSKKTLYVGGPKAYKKTKLVATVKPAKASKKVKYSSSNKKVATVNKKGAVTARKVGKTYITVTSKSNKKVKKKIKITVKKYVCPKKIKVKAANSLNSGQKLKIKTTFSPSSTTNKNVTYKSNNKNLATVSSKGVVTANKNDRVGTVKITVTTKARNSKKKTLKKTIKISVKKKIAATSVKMSSSSRTMLITGTTKNPTTFLSATVVPTNTYNKALTWRSSNTSVATVSSVGKVTAKKMGKATITAKSANGKIATCVVTVKRSSVSVHDPSVIKGNDGSYYIFGSHMAWAKTNTLTGWTGFTNNINKNTTNTGNLFATYWEKWAKYNNKGTPNKLNNDGDTIALNGNLWAPDVIYNKQMKKWCMYMSVNGPDYNSVIVMCTADRLDGDWKVVGPVIYSGFTNKTGVASHDYTLTDYKKVTGDTSLANRYGGANWNVYYGTNAIDPSVKYDEDGNLWMVYGSWFGGLYMLKLDANTGLRDYTNKYEYNTDDTDGTTSDPYMGIRIAGGSRASGEGAYLMEADGYYYMFISYGGLVADGGYNMRLFRSEKIEGPYVDARGKTALRTSNNDGGNTLGNVGIRLMSGYKWPCNTKGYLAQGHNSSFVDTDGKMYLVFHTRTDDGTEGHYVKTHQMFMNEEGWLCVAPYEYNDETISKTGYSKNDMVGTYDYLVQNPSQRNGTCATPTKITLGADGCIGGVDTAGTWTYKNGTCYATFTISGVKYSGVFAKGYMEDDARTEVMTFTAVGENNICIWGSKTSVANAKTAQSTDANALTLQTSVGEDFTLPTYGGNGSTITWTASDSNVIAISGRKAIINRRLSDTKATLTATIKNGTYSSTKKFEIKVDKYDVTVDTKIDADNISLPTKVGSANVQWTSSNQDVIALDGTVAKVVNDTDVTLTATMRLDEGIVNEEVIVRTFDVTVEGIVINVPSIVKTNSIDLPTEAEGYAITWSSSDNDVINASTGVVVKPENEKVTVTLTATVGPNSETREISVTVLPENYSDYVYDQDYQNVINVDDVFSSTSLSGGRSIASEGNNKFLQFAQDGSSGNRGGIGNFNSKVNELTDYVVELDVSLRSGNVNARSMSQLVLTGTDTDATAGNNGGVTSGYILKLATPALQSNANTTTWYVNDSGKSIEIPTDTWVHVTVVVSTTNKTAEISITNAGDPLFNETVDINGTGNLQGLYILSGRGNGLTKVDNIKVY